MNIFERAAKEKIRFEFRGLIATEDLWDLTIENLDELFQQTYAQLKAQSGEGLLLTGVQNPISDYLRLQADLIRYVFEDKQKMAADFKMKKLQNEKKKRIMEIITDKQDETLASKSVAELKEMLDDM